MSLKEIRSLCTTMLANIDNDLKDQELFKMIQDKTGLRPSKICIIAVALICILVVFDILGDIITNLFGMIYPSYMTFKVALSLCRLLRRKMRNRKRSG